MVEDRRWKIATFNPRYAWLACESGLNCPHHIDVGQMSAVLAGAVDVLDHVHVTRRFRRRSLDQFRIKLFSEQHLLYPASAESFIRYSRDSQGDPAANARRIHCKSHGDTNHGKA